MSKRFNLEYKHGDKTYNLNFGGAAEQLRQMTAIKMGTYDPNKDYSLQDSGPIRVPTEPKPTTPAKPSTPQQPTPTPQPTTPTPQQPAPTTPQQPVPTQPPTVQPQPTLPKYTPPEYKQISYDQARNQAASQLDPTYQHALQEIQRQRAVNQQQAGDLAASRGLGRSGLSADLQNKVNIAALQQGAGLAAQRASQEAQMAQALMDKDFTRQQQLRDSAFREYLGQGQMGLDQARFDWQRQQGASDTDFRNKQLEWQKQMGQSDIDYRNQQSKQQQEQYNRDYILRQLQAMANAGIDISKLQEKWLLKPWG
ncbi:hypothetical protein ABH14_00380 [Brevibacillus brevis]|uniref:hypothetical protein n=1 Tax=Brevibacillus brevis TaxID=1393 RepID=UPI0019016537|nr:hypothetical protein [Brevibacillus brevis]MBH0328268.1 hypothetical protein [Brevibacillus brevis]